MLHLPRTNSNNTHNILFPVGKSNLGTRKRIASEFQLESMNLNILFLNLFPALVQITYPRSGLETVDDQKKRLIIMPEHMNVII